MEKLIYLLWGAGTPEGATPCGSGCSVRPVAAPAATAGVRGLVDQRPRLRGGRGAIAGAAASRGGAPRGRGRVLARLLRAAGRGGGGDRRPRAPVRRLPGRRVALRRLRHHAACASPGTGRTGDRSPGVLTVALIHRPDGLERSEWIDRWHGTQSPVSARAPAAHPLRAQRGGPSADRRVRRRSTGSSTRPGRPPGTWPTRCSSSTPTSADELDANVSRMMESVNACLDLARLRSSTMSEYLLRSVG